MDTQNNNDLLENWDKDVEDFSHDDNGGDVVPLEIILNYIPKLLEAQAAKTREEDKEKIKYKLPDMILKELLADLEFDDLSSGSLSRQFYHYYNDYRLSQKKAYEYRKQGIIEGAGFDNANYWQGRIGSNRAHLHRILSEILEAQQQILDDNPKIHDN